MHVIMGAGGIIAKELTRPLLELGQRVRLVSRSVQPQPGVETVAADLTDAAQTRAAVAGASTVYLVAGLPYRTAVWEKDWPRVMRHTIDACKATGAQLVFFDNVYAYGRVAGPMTEDTPFNPCSKKGEVRARIATQLLDAIKAGELQAMIARAPDFYGPGCDNSVYMLLVVDKLAVGGTARWPGRDDVPHSLIYTPDAGRAVALLGTSDSAWNQTWHLPVAAPALTGREFIARAAEVFGVPAKHGVLGRGPFRLAGWINRDARESLELFYQCEEPYVFEAAKFARAFAFTPTGYGEGLKQIAAFRRANAG
jgi:nucleoside-diphosphate-sugar epimerase